MPLWHHIQNSLPYSVADTGFPIGGMPTHWGGTNLRHICFSVKMYAKTNELDPLRGLGCTVSTPISANAIIANGFFFLTWITKGSCTPSVCVNIQVNICVCEFTMHIYLMFEWTMLFCLFCIANANASLGPEAKLAMLVCVIASASQMETLGVFRIIDTNGTHWIHKRKRKL